MRGSFLLEDAGEGEELPGFDIDAPELPEEIDKKAFRSGGYPYNKRMKRKRYDEELLDLQIELLKLQRWVEREGKRLVIVFEGRDAAGKDGCIKRILAHLNPRHARQVALSKPTDAERGQWYFQRYVAELPTAGDMLIFNRSWYNRAGVEPVMGYCTEEQYHRFMEAVPQFEAGLVHDGIILIKLWLSVGREMQLKRFHARRHDVLKRWKLTDNDVRGLALFDAYTAARDRMFARTDTSFAPWLVVRSNDKRRARLNAIRAILHGIQYDGKDPEVADAPDPKIVGRGPDFFATA
ncbi:Polyphosphate kinase 2 (PPK2) [Methyloligella halotolerans]|uniref:ADP/GDP-polyphosphate phosphotransferase n=1 Tax=Methyloligella halotolerans TaxID=1177755 RepID=A0A1E2RXS4_9HYPH|nr:polyphosphate kinase 2 [Methyloligella halotolerans]ODA67037.1 Polyphosphate kinase 2 (PPK2) [Methyloligella halotolerans]